MLFTVLLQTVEFFFFAVLMFLTTVVFSIMSLFYKYANGSVVSGHEAGADADNLHLTSTAEPVANQKESASEHR